MHELYLGNECMELLNSLPIETGYSIRKDCLKFYVTAAVEIQKRPTLNNNLFNPDIVFSE